MISFIVPAYNEEQCLRATLASIFSSAAAAGVEFEVIVVNDASTDKTAEIARDCGARVIDVHKRQIAGTRNAGAKEARGDILIFVDADTLLPIQPLQDALAAIEAGAIGGGARVVILDQIPFLSRVAIRIFTFFYFLARLAAGCFVFVRRDAFEKVGGFDERYFASEEVHLSRALRRVGRFVILRSHVVTSGRKARQYSFTQLMRLMGTFMVHGPGYLRKREGLDFWYNGKREDP